MPDPSHCETDPNKLIELYGICPLISTTAAIPQQTEVPRLLPRQQPGMVGIATVPLFAPCAGPMCQVWKGPAEGPMGMCSLKRLAYDVKALADYYEKRSINQ